MVNSAGSMKRERKTLRLLKVDGYPLPPSFDLQLFRDSIAYKPDKGRVIVATYPKCGTTWTLQIVMLILRKGVPPADSVEYFSLIAELGTLPLKDLLNLPKDVCIKMHFRFDKITFSNEAKYVYVARHPADCLISFYHHTRLFPIYFFTDGTFEEFFEAFMTGDLEYGDYFDHLLLWYDRRHEPNVLFLTYESLKSDTKEMILKVAKFIGEEFYEDLILDDEKILKNVLEYSSIDFMKITTGKYWDDFCSGPSKEQQEKLLVSKNFAELVAQANKEGHFSNGNFVRKGVVGEGKIILSEEQKIRLEARIREKCGHSDVMDLWKSY